MPDYRVTDDRNKKKIPNCSVASAEEKILSYTSAQASIRWIAQNGYAVVQCFVASLSNSVLPFKA